MTAIDVKVHGAAGTITIDRAGKCNALDRSAIDDLAQAFFDLHQEKKARGVILIGKGANFSAGLDLAEMHQTKSADESQAMHQWHQDWSALKELLETMLRFPKPIVAAVDGHCLGAGLALALASDMVIATEAAQFGIPTAKRGLLSGLVAPLLNFRCGGKITATMMLTGESVDADAALQKQFIDEVVASDLLWARAVHWIETCAVAPGESIQLSKRLINETIAEHVFTQLSVGTAMSATACTTEAASEGLAAFVEKRDPNWP